MADPLANAFKSPPKNALEHAVGALPATLVGLAPAAATLFALLSDGRPLSIAGGAATVLGAFLSVTSARGGRRVASETVRLQEGLTDLESKGVLLAPTCTKNGFASWCATS